MLRIAFLFAFCACAAMSTWAQGVLIGRVTSQGKALPFASVYLQDGPLGAAADAEGMYRLNDVPVQTWTAVASNCRDTKRDSF